MDGDLGVSTADTYYINNKEIMKWNNDKPSEHEIIVLETYDDLQQPEKLCSIKPNVNLPNQDNHQSTDGASDENRFKYVGKRCVMCFLVIGWLTGVALFVFSYTLNTSGGISSSSKPLMNPDLCDPVNPYYDSSWFTPSPTDHLICDVPFQISEIYIQPLYIFRTNIFDKCENKLDCMSLIGLYMELNKNPIYNFYIDQNSNVYAGRDWLCPYKSGQLWVGVITKNYFIEEWSEEIKCTLQHLKTEMFSYAVSCDYFINDGLRTIYLNNTHISS